ncbi:PIN domain-containing protein [Lewinella sp. W8]|uniref:type II toxin-antitoxin system VapC family toxin n=1 Tax=Lewinella sp. W8 TaxID=2528208 RepID=UPI0010671A4F|nr:PIN domain-containing protein [Lewinella sp. W8]MTB52410.1 PIN domain-containing protein [Lewinella sp. W8]
MKTAFLDTNIILDYVLGRVPFYHDALQILSLAKSEQLRCLANPNSFTIAYFYLKKDGHDSWEIKHKFALLRQVIECASIDAAVLDSALTLKRPKDLEDGVQLAAALAEGADVLITRDVKGFPKDKLLIQTPKQFLSDWDYS